MTEVMEKSWHFEKALQPPLNELTKGTSSYNLITKNKFIDMDFYWFGHEKGHGKVIESLKLSMKSRNPDCAMMFWERCLNNESFGRYLLEESTYVSYNDKATKQNSPTRHKTSLQIE